VRIPSHTNNHTITTLITILITGVKGEDTKPEAASPVLPGSSISGDQNIVDSISIGIMSEDTLGENSDEERIAPGYGIICLSIARELEESLMLSTWIKDSHKPIICKPLSLFLAFSGFGHPFTSFGCKVWAIVLWRYVLFLQVCLGFWTPDLADYYDLEEKFKETDFISHDSCENSIFFKNRNYTLMLESTIGPRAVIWQIIPGLTFLSQYTILTVGSPLVDPCSGNFCSTNEGHKQMNAAATKTLPKIRSWYVTWEESYELSLKKTRFTNGLTDEALGEENMNWIIACDAVGILTAESRLVQLLLSWLKFICTVLILYSPDNTIFGIICKALCNYIQKLNFIFSLSQCSCCHNVMLWVDTKLPVHRYDREVIGCQR